MMVYPIVSSMNGKTIAAHKSQDGALGVASALVRHASGAELVYVGEPFETELSHGMLTVGGVTVPLNPVYALAKDPYRLMVTRLLDMAREPRTRARRATGTGTTATRAAKTTGAGTRTAKTPATTGKATTGAAKTGAATRKTRVGAAA